MRFLLTLAGAILVTACGQTGALYLPDEEVETPVEIRAPATAPATTPPASTQPAPVPEPDEDEQRRKDAPPPSG